MKNTSLPLGQLETWSKLNNIVLHNVKVTSQVVTQDGSDKGGGLFATADHAASDVLLSVPSDLVLSKEQVEQCAKTDARLKEVLDAVGAFGQVGCCGTR